MDFQYPSSTLSPLQLYEPWSNSTLSAIVGSLLACLTALKALQK